MLIENEFGKCEYSFEEDGIGEYVHIYNLYVYPRFRRQGKAKELLIKAIKEIKESEEVKEILIVADPREDSISREALAAFYRRLGLKVFECYL